MYECRDKTRVIHGSDWKSMMVFFGVDPDRCHDYDYDCSKVRTRTIQKWWVYTCKCQIHMVSTVIHNRIRKGQERSCCRCESDLVYDGA